MLSRANSPLRLFGSQRRAHHASGHGNTACPFENSAAHLRPDDEPQQSWDMSLVVLSALPCSGAAPWPASPHRYVHSMKRPLNAVVRQAPAASFCLSYGRVSSSARFAPTDAGGRPPSAGAREGQGRAPLPPPCPSPASDASAGAGARLGKDPLAPPSAPPLSRDSAAAVAATSRRSSASTARRALRAASAADPDGMAILGARQRSHVRLRM